MLHTIRQATTQDAQNIHAIATLLSKNNIEKQTQNGTTNLSTTGFLLYPLSAKNSAHPNYAERTKSKHFWVATDKENKIISFMMAYTFKEMRNFKQLTPNDKDVAHHFTDNARMSENTIYMAQIGTHPDFKRKNIMSQVINHALKPEHTDHSPEILAEVAQAPLRNEASSNLLMKHGFYMIGTRTKDTEKPKNKQRISGIFTKKLRQTT